MPKPITINIDGALFAMISRDPHDWRIEWAAGRIDHAATIQEAMYKIAQTL